MAERVKPPVSGERISFAPNLIGLQSRLLLGKTALNPSEHVAEAFDPSGVPSFAARNYEVFEVASDTERRNYWGAKGIPNVEDQIRVWSQSMSSLVTNKSFSDTEKAFYARLGIDTDNFSAQSATNFYETHFAYNPDGIKSFVGTVINAHIDPDSGAFHWDELISNLDTITWFSHVFGSRSAEIVAQLVDAEVKLEINPEVFTHDPNRLNNLTERESEILGFIWQNKDGNNKPEIPTQTENEAYEIADRLIDYKTGSVTDEHIDLLPYYSGFVSDMRAKLDSNHPLFGRRENKIVLSNLAVAMIDRVATRSNEVNKELGFTIQGNNIGQEGEFIFTGAYIAPVLDFTVAQESTMSPDFTLNNRLKKLLGRNTNLSNYFLQTTGKKTGDRLGTLHIHQAPLGEKYRAQPSTGDIAYVERILQETKRKFYIWGVVTKSHGDLEMIVVLSKRDQSGTIVHEEIPVKFEADFQHEIPLAA